MKAFSARFTALSLLFVLVIAASCSDSESRVPFGQLATVVINLNLPAERPTAMNDSIWNTIRRLFARDAVAQTAPATFSQINVRVTGPDMGAIEQQFNPYAQISMSVPAGSFRQVEVTAFVAPGDPSAALSFRGTAVANLPAGQTVSVPVVMELNETKIVAPDNYTARMVQINNLSITGWKDRDATELGITGPFSPYDVDFDSMGRIYIANDVFGADDILRIDSMEGGNVQQYDILPGTVNNLNSISIDRKNGVVYFASTTELGMAPLDNIAGGATRLDSTWSIFHNIRGIDTDGRGMIYMVNGPGPSYYITKYDPQNDSIVGSQQLLADLNYPQDITVRYPYLFVANYGGANGATPSDGYQILKYRIDGNSFTLVGHYGNRDATGENYNPGIFYGTRKFLAIRNDSIIVIDNNESGGGPWYCKLVSFSLVPGIGWSTFGSYGTQTGEFKFYSAC